MEKVKEINLVEGIRDTKDIKEIDLEELCEMEEIVTPAPYGDTTCCFKN